jgi:hypothetical protein
LPSTGENKVIIETDVTLERAVTSVSFSSDSLSAKLTETNKYFFYNLRITTKGIRIEILHVL